MKRCFWGKRHTAIRYTVSAISCVVQKGDLTHGLPTGFPLLKDGLFFSFAALPFLLLTFLLLSSTLTRRVAIMPIRKWIKAVKWCFEVVGSGCGSWGRRREVDQVANLGIRSTNALPGTTPCWSLSRLFEGGDTSRGRKGNGGFENRFQGKYSCGLCSETPSVSHIFEYQHGTRDPLTFRLFPVASLSASNPPGSRLLLRNFFSLTEFFWESRLRLLSAPICVVKFSLSVSPLRLVCGIGARDCR